MEAPVSCCADPFEGLWIMWCLWPCFWRFYLEYLFSTNIYIYIYLYISNFLAYLQCPQMTQQEASKKVRSVFDGGFELGSCSVLLTRRGHEGMGLGLPAVHVAGGWLLAAFGDRAVLGIEGVLMNCTRLLFFTRYVCACKFACTHIFM